MASIFPFKPTTSSSKSITPRVRFTQFGNGYKQVYGDGINNLLEIWNVNFKVNNADKKTIETFFRTTAGYNYFNWTSPEEGATQKQYLCTNWTINPLGKNTYSISATFEQFAGAV